MRLNSTNSRPHIEGRYLPASERRRFGNGVGAFHFCVALRGNLDELIGARSSRTNFAAFEEAKPRHPAWTVWPPIWSETSVRR